MTLQIIAVVPSFGNIRNKPSHSENQTNRQQFLLSHRDRHLYDTGRLYFRPLGCIYM